MNTFTVYRVDYARGTRVPIATIQERRAMERGGNFFGLVQLARKLYSESPIDAFRITVRTSQTAEAGHR